MRRYLWIIVSLVLPVAFIIVMKFRPPVSPGVEVRVEPAAVTAPATGKQPERQVGAVDAGLGGRAASDGGTP